MCHLVMDASASVQRMAYQLLQEAAKKYTEELVIEAAVDTEGTMKPELPVELLDVLQQSLNHDDTEEYGQVGFLAPRSDGLLRDLHSQGSGYLLAWMVALDLFTDAVRDPMLHLQLPLFKPRTILVLESQVRLRRPAPRPRSPRTEATAHRLRSAEPIWRYGEGVQARYLGRR